jgi:perosamine synthetase
MAESHLDDLQRSAADLPDDQRASGRSFGERELALIREVLASGTLTTTKGEMGRRLEDNFARRCQRRQAIALSSGSAAIHAAVAALDAEPGEEVITTPITDMGALACILQQGLIPVFADVDPRTGNILLDSVRERISDRTRAVIVTHLFGRLVDMKGFRKLADDAGLVLIEDAAQAFLAERDGHHAGGTGDLAAFSFQQGKHLTAGEGGILVGDDAGLMRGARMFVNKSWPYGESNPDHESIAPNYRTNELTAAVLLGQVERLEEFLAQRRHAVRRFRAGLSQIPGVDLPAPEKRSDPAWWRLGLVIDDAIIPGGNLALGQALRERKLGAGPRYVGKPAFACRVFRERKTFGTSQWPFPLARPEALDWSDERFPGVHAFLDQVLVLAINERYRDEDIDLVLSLVHDAVSQLRRAQS